MRCQCQLSTCVLALLACVETLTSLTLVLALPAAAAAAGVDAELIDNNEGRSPNNILTLSTSTSRNKVNLTKSAANSRLDILLGQATSTATSERPTPTQSPKSRVTVTSARSRDLLYYTFADPNPVQASGSTATSHNSTDELDSDHLVDKHPFALVTVAVILIISLIFIFTLFLGYKLCNLQYERHMQKRIAQNVNPAGGQGGLRSISVGSILVPSELLQRYSQGQGGVHPTGGHNNQMIALTHSETCPVACTLCCIGRTLALSTSAFHPRPHGSREHEEFPPTPTPPPKYIDADPSLPTYDSLFSSNQGGSKDPESPDSPGPPSTSTSVKN